MLRTILTQFSKQLPRTRNLSYMRKLKYCTEPTKDFINKNTLSQPSPNYYDQYIEEYYEVDESNVDEKVIPLHLQNLERKTSIEKKLIDLVDEEELIKVLENERALNIECIPIEKKDDSDLKAYDIAIICSPYNNKHGESLINVVKKYIKENYRFENNQYPTVVENNNGWFIYDMRKIILHVMTSKMRERYDLESLYRNTEEELDEMLDNESIEGKEEEEIIIVEKKE
uniref:Ribosomal silencing factor RsfS n=1 Tax=Strongyloides venezuelensis TaxID=75913 RepID=A0A0K0FTX0_STRVS